MGAITQFVTGEDNEFANIRGTDKGGDSAFRAMMPSKVQVPGMDCTIRVSSYEPYNTFAICLERFAGRYQAEAAYAALRASVDEAAPRFVARDHIGHGQTPPMVVRYRDYTYGRHWIHVGLSVFWKTYPSYGLNAVVDYYQVALSFGLLQAKRGGN